MRCGAWRGHRARDPRKRSDGFDERPLLGRRELLDPPLLAQRVASGRRTAWSTPSRPAGAGACSGWRCRPGAGARGARDRWSSRSTGCRRRSAAGRRRRSRGRCSPRGGYFPLDRPRVEASATSARARATRGADPRASPTCGLALRRRPRLVAGSERLLARRALRHVLLDQLHADLLVASCTACSSPLAAFSQISSRSAFTSAEMPGCAPICCLQASTACWTCGSDGSAPPPRSPPVSVRPPVLGRSAAVVPPPRCCRRRRSRPRPRRPPAARSRPAPVASSLRSTCLPLGGR